MAQLLIDMPAESAARLLTLSLLEQLSLHTAPRRTAPLDGVRDVAAVVVRGDGYRAALNRLRGCIAIYDEILGASITRKVRRRLRTTAKAANDLHDVDVQLAWLARAVRAGATSDVKPDVTARAAPRNGGTDGVAADAATDPVDAPLPPRLSAQGALAAHWLGDRLARRRERLALGVTQAQEDTRPLRRLAKRLSVYTTAIHLDDMSVSVSFAELTGQRLAAASASLRAELADAGTPNDARALRRAQRAADHVMYLLDAVRSGANAGQLADTAHELRSAIARLRESAVVADALIRSGRRIGALQMTTRLRRTVWACAAGRDGGEPPNAAAGSVLPDEIGPGLLSLAEKLRDECSQSFDAFSLRWRAAGSDEFFDGLERVAMSLAPR